MGSYAMKDKWIFAVITIVILLMAIFLAPGRLVETAPSSAPSLSAGGFPWA